MDALRAKLAEAEARAAAAEAGLRERAEQYSALGMEFNEGNKAIDVLFICALFNKHDFAAVGSLCRATRREEVLWSALARVHHGPGMRTVLMHAAARDQLDRVRWLLKRGAPPDAKDVDGKTALIYACAHGHADVARVLLEAGAGVDVADDFMTTPLITTMGSSRPLDVVRVLLAANADVNCARYDGDTALTVASSNGHTDAVGWLLAAGADVHAQCDGDGGKMAIHYASACGHANIVRALLLHNRSLVNAIDHELNTPLHHAGMNEHYHVAIVLLALGANTSRINARGESAVMASSSRELSFLIAASTGIGAVR